MIIIWRIKGNEICELLSITVGQLASYYLKSFTLIAGAGCQSSTSVMISSHLRLGCTEELETQMLKLLAGLEAKVIYIPWYSE